MTKQLIVNANYNGLDVSFTGDGWFNATQAAKRFGKEPYMWLRQRETVEYISTLSEMNGNSVFVEDFNKISTIDLPISLLATCQPSYAEVGKSLFGGNSDFVQELNKISYLSPLTVSKEKVFLIYLLFSIDLIAVTGNNLKQELRNLLKTVSHRTLADVFLCLSFNNLSFTGKLYLALALVRFWQGGRGNKPLGANTVCRLFLAVSNLLAALPLGRIFKTSLPFEKV